MTRWRGADISRQLRKLDSVVYIRLDVRSERRKRSTSAEVRQVLRIGFNDANVLESEVSCHKWVIYLGRVCGRCAEVDSYIQ
jgi:hypothetical protein